MTCCQQWSDFNQKVPQLIMSQQLRPQPFVDALLQNTCHYNNIPFSHDNTTSCLNDDITARYWLITKPIGSLLPPLSPAVNHSKGKEVTIYQGYLCHDRMMCFYVHARCSKSGNLCRSWPQFAGLSSSTEYCMAH